MTYNEPGRNPPRYEGHSYREQRDNTWAWVLGAILAILLIGGGIYYAASDGDQVASTPPAATTGAGPTAGQGANKPTTPPAQPAAPANR
jgi:hypothetical protein